MPPYTITFVFLILAVTGKIDWYIPVQTGPEPYLHQWGIKPTLPPGSDIHLSIPCID
jgi:hypothetical protein